MTRSASATASFFLLTSVHALRGKGGDVCYCDEAAYMPISLFHEVVVPVFEVRGTVLIMISTLSSSWNYYTKMLDKGEELMAAGREMFLVMRVELICARCKTRGHDAVNCRHRLGEIPPWKDPSKLDVVKELLGGDGNLDTMKKESMGVLGDDTTRVFEEEHIAELSQRPLFGRKRDVVVRFMVVMIDPNANGSSQTAVCAVARIEGKIVVCILSHLHPLSPSLSLSASSSSS